MKKIVALILAVLCVVGLMVGCSSNENALERIQNEGKIVMYTNAEFPPYEFAGADNEIVGVDVEIGKAIAEKLGVELEIYNTNFDGIVSAIASGKGDLGLSGITINDERKEEVDFSHPYVDAIQYLIVAEGSEIATMDDLADKKIGGQTGTTGYLLVEDEIIKGSLKDTGAELSPYNSAPNAMLDLVNGRLDAVVIDEMVAIQIASEYDGYTAVPFTYADGVAVTEQYGVAIQKGQEDLLKIVDEVVDELVNGGKIEEYTDYYTAMFEDEE